MSVEGLQPTETGSEVPPSLIKDSEKPEIKTDGYAAAKEIAVDIINTSISNSDLEGKLCGVVAEHFANLQENHAPSKDIFQLVELNNKIESVFNEFKVSHAEDKSIDLEKLTNEICSEVMPKVSENLFEFTIQRSQLS